MGMKESKSGRSRETLDDLLANARRALRDAEAECDEWEDEIAGLEDELTDLDSVADDDSEAP